MALAFLDQYRWGRGRGVVLTSILPGGGTTTASFSPEQRNECGEWIAEQNKTRGVYHTVNITNGTLTNKAAKSDISHCWALHVDLDDPSDEALARLRAFSPPPSCIVFSGGGFNGYWLLHKPVKVTETDEIEDRNRLIEQTLDADHCHNLDRILRLPGTINIPNAKKRAAGRVRTMARLVEFNDRRYSLEDFKRAGRRGSQPTRARRIIPVIEGDLPEIDLAALPVADDMKAMIRLGRYPGIPDFYPSRSEAVYAVTCALVRAGCSDELVAAALLDPDLGISESVLEKQDPLRYALRQISNARSVDDG